MRNFVFDTLLAACCVMAVSAFNQALAQPSDARPLDRSLTAEAIENRVKSDWKAERKKCKKADRSEIAGVDLISADDYKAWLQQQGSNTQQMAEVVQGASYIKLTALPEKKDVAVYGPLRPDAKATDFRNLVGMQICKRPGAR